MIEWLSNDSNLPKVEADYDIKDESYSIVEGMLGVIMKCEFRLIRRGELVERESDMGLLGEKIMLKGLNMSLVF